MFDSSQIGAIKIRCKTENDSLDINSETTDNLSLSYDLYDAPTFLESKSEKTPIIDSCNSKMINLMFNKVMIEQNYMKKELSKLTEANATLNKIVKNLSSKYDALKTVLFNRIGDKNESLVNDEITRIIN